MTSGRCWPRAAGRMPETIAARQRTTEGIVPSGSSITLAEMALPSAPKLVVRMPMSTAAPISVEHIISAGPACRLMIFLCIFAVKP